jgi:hypothetical protein
LEGIKARRETWRDEGLGGAGAAKVGELGVGISWCKISSDIFLSYEESEGCGHEGRGESCLASREMELLDVQCFSLLNLFIWSFEMEKTMRSSGSRRKDQNG